MSMTIYPSTPKQVKQIVRERDMRKWIAKQAANDDDCSSCPAIGECAKSCCLNALKAKWLKDHPNASVIYTKTRTRVTELSAEDHIEIVKDHIDSIRDAISKRFTCYIGTEGAEYLNLLNAIDDELNCLLDRQPEPPTLDQIRENGPEPYPIRETSQCHPKEKPTSTTS